MYLLSNELVTRWVVLSGVNAHVPQAINGPCPNPECGRSPVTFSLGSAWKQHGPTFMAHSKCPSCEKGAWFFLFDAARPGGGDNTERSRIYVDPTPPLLADIDGEVARISDRFAAMYRQALIAEGQGLDMLVGMGLRRALEFLIKDYLISQSPDRADEIEQKRLYQLITQDVADPNIKECAMRATWLGNDETHSVREWGDRDVEDLKRLLKLTLYWISMELLTAQYMAEMPDKKESKKK